MDVAIRRTLLIGIVRSIGVLNTRSPPLMPRRSFVIRVRRFIRVGVIASRRARGSQITRTFVALTQTANKRLA